MLSKLHKNDSELSKDIRKFTEVNNERTERFKTITSTHVRTKGKNNEQTWHTHNNIINSEQLEQKSKPSKSILVKRN